jgi:EAL domain-containing protein (putative c-di-GMP-specific phosphodiesterase class I)
VVRLGQGFYFGRPLEAGDMDRLVGDELTAGRAAAGT